MLNGNLRSANLSTGFTTCKFYVGRKNIQFLTREEQRWGTSGYVYL